MATARRHCKLIISELVGKVRYAIVDAWKGNAIGAKRSEMRSSWRSLSRSLALMSVASIVHRGIMRAKGPCCPAIRVNGAGDNLHAPGAVRIAVLWVFIPPLIITVSLSVVALLPVASEFSIQEEVFGFFLAIQTCTRRTVCEREELFSEAH